MDATHGLAPEHHVADGFLHGVDASTDPTLATPLDPSSWVADDDEEAYNSAIASGARVILPLSDAWGNATYSAKRGGPVPPWEVLPAYARFVRAFVASVKASGKHVDYWEVQNEPDTPISGQRATPQQALAQFATAVSAIRSVEPSAKIIGPSISSYNDQPGPTLDLSTFLDFVVANHIRLDAVAWHEVGARVRPTDNPPDPESVVIDVARARALIAARPALGHPAIIIDEYASGATHAIPGWTVGWIEALERSGVGGADRACWHQPNVIGVRIAECDEGGLDGLFLPGSGLPQALYWVYRYYAGMSGVRVATGATDTRITALATRDDSAHTIEVMVGRHQSCTPEVRADCKEPESAVPAATSVDVQVTNPWPGRTFGISVEQIPNLWSIVPSPIPVTDTTLVASGRHIDVQLPDFADGDAYTITISPATG